MTSPDLAAMARLADETGWLIEDGASEPCTPTYYGYVAGHGGDDGPGLDWTKNHHDALRFARKIDAERFAADIGWNNVRICEHEWSGPSLRAKAPVPVAERAIVRMLEDLAIVYCPHGGHQGTVHQAVTLLTTLAAERKVLREALEHARKQIMRIGNMINHGGASASWASGELLTLFCSLLPALAQNNATDSGGKKEPGRE